MKSIAEHLGVDERLVVDLASGEIDDIEAYQEWNGYGAFTIDARVFDSAKKRFLQKEREHVDTRQRSRVQSAL